jgi:hypothetical protein
MTGVVGRPQEVASASMVEALKETFTVESAARLCGCSAPLIAVRAKHDPAVAAAVANQEHSREENIALALRKHRGVLSRVADELGLGSAAAVRYHVSRSMRLQQVFVDSRDRIVDRAEENVFDAVERGSVDDSWKMLKTLGKNRGYAERKEIDQRVEHTVNVKASGELLNALNGMVRSQPSLVETQFATLSGEERELLHSALERLTVQNSATPVDGEFTVDAVDSFGGESESSVG